MSNAEISLWIFYLRTIKEQYIYSSIELSEPATVAEWSRACTVFALSEAGIVGSNPTQGMDVWYVYVFILCSCCPVLSRGLATSCSLVQGVLPPVK
jgi:hypothetical protein